MATDVKQLLNDHMTRIQLRLVTRKLGNQRLEEETEGARSESHLQVALQNRQNLLNKIREERDLERELVRPSTDLDLIRPQSQDPRLYSRSSLPPLVTAKHQTYPNYHHFPGYAVDTVATPLPVPVYYPPPHTYAPGPKQVMMEMMIMQSAQMHQIMMNQMMMQAFSNQKDSSATFPHLSTNQLLHSQHRPPSVHHHHFDTYSQVSTLPYIPRREVRNDYYSTEVQPLLAHKVNPRQRKLPFPGGYALRRFRHVAYAALFCEILKRRKRTVWKNPVKTNSDFFFAIRIKEIVAAVHKIYLDKDEKIRPLLTKLLYDDTVDLTPAVESNNSRLRKQATQNLTSLIEDLVFSITEIMPATGVLGTQKKSAVNALVQPGQSFPRGYLWDIEQHLLSTDQLNSVASMSDQYSLILLVGMFVGRCLVSTLLLKPVEYGILERATNSRPEKNAKILATTLIYILRKAYKAPKDKLPPIPYELSADLITDSMMSDVYNKIKKPTDYCKGLLQAWSTEYVKRLRTASNRK